MVPKLNIGEREKNAVFFSSFFQRLRELVPNFEETQGKEDIERGFLHDQLKEYFYEIGGTDPFSVVPFMSLLDDINAFAYFMAEENGVGFVLHVLGDVYPKYKGELLIAPRKSLNDPPRCVCYYLDQGHVVGSTTRPVVEELPQDSSFVLLYPIGEPIKLERQVTTHMYRLSTTMGLSDHIGMGVNL